MIYLGDGGSPPERLKSKRVKHNQQHTHRHVEVKNRHLPLRGGQDIPEEDGIPHAEDLLLIRGEGYNTHRF